MPSLPIDGNNLGITIHGYSKPKIGYNSDKQETDRRTGLPVWIENAVRFDPLTKELEIMRFVVASREDPAAGIEFGTPVTVEGIRFSSGAFDDGRIWSKYSAERVLPAKK